MIPGTADGGQGIIPIFTSYAGRVKAPLLPMRVCFSIGGNPKGSLRKSLGGESQPFPEPHCQF